MRLTTYMFQPFSGIFTEAFKSVHSFTVNRQPQETQGHFLENEDELLQKTIACNSNNKFYAPDQTVPGADPASFKMGSGSPSRGKAAGALR